MAFNVMHRDGSMDDSVRASFDALVAELDGPHDPEHPNVAVSHESGLTLSAFASGLVIFENVEDDSVEPRHLLGVSRAHAAELFCLLSVADLAALERDDWQSG